MLDSWISGHSSRRITILLGDAWSLLKSLNTIWIGSHKLRVFLGHDRLKGHPVIMKKKEERDGEAKTRVDKNEAMEEEMGSSPVEKEKVDTVSAKDCGSISNLEVSALNEEYLQSCVICETKDFAPLKVNNATSLEVLLGNNIPSLKELLKSVEIWRRESYPSSSTSMQIEVDGIHFSIGVEERENLKFEADNTMDQASSVKDFMIDFEVENQEEDVGGEFSKDEGEVTTKEWSLWLAARVRVALMRVAVVVGKAEMEIDNSKIVLEKAKGSKDEGSQETAVKDFFPVQISNGSLGPLPCNQQDLDIGPTEVNKPIVEPMSNNEGEPSVGRSGLKRSSFVQESMGFGRKLSRMLMRDSARKNGRLSQSPSNPLKVGKSEVSLKRT
ncbi:hypothetical protein L6452_26187 [Arctium lappa]|uniref:Uncharacterized protein n=1 Tax=Arctium lappa TaxID=4217 RepID=A0ACB9ADH1_ARCLA|nr:hypothetical protein L6452_26187 [Arctium lappa]